MNYAATISNDDLNAMPVATFAGRILVVDDPEGMSQAETILKGEQLLGIDTETRPAFTKGLVYQMALLQVSTADTAILFRLQQQPLSPAIKQIMENARVKKIGAALRDDIKGIQKSQGRFKAAGFIDLQNIIGQWGVEDKSVKKMSGIVLGFKVSKAQRLSNWEAKTLTHAQQQYAAIDAWICREIYVHLNKNLPTPQHKVE